MNIVPATTSPACPHDDQLRAFCAAVLPTEQMDAVEKHLRDCEVCLHALDAFDEESDTLIQVLSTLPSNTDDEFALVRARERLLSEPTPLLAGDAPTISIAGATATSHDRLPEYPDHVGDYQLLELVGRGASGAVFRARHAKLDRMVAVKILSSRYVLGDQQAVVRFQQEMRAVGRLNHPNIIQATDAGEDGGHHYLVMEYVRGVDLSRLLRFTGPLRIADACELVKQAALALQVAHDHKLVHRDVKPSNLFFTFDGHLKLLDLGLASIDDDGPQPEDAGIPFGTGDYMSPEQWQDFENVDARADIYSLGCTLYKLLTGEPVYPVSRQHHGEKMQAHLSQPIPSLRTLRPEAPLGLQKVVTKMLAKQADQRFQTAAEIADHLDSYAFDARLDSLSERLATVPRDELYSQAVHRPTATGKPPGTTRRRMLIGAAGLTPLVVAGLLFRPRQEESRLQTNVWRPLVPTESPSSFATTANDLQLPSAVVEASGNSQHVDLTAPITTILEMGKPVIGRYQLRTTVSLGPSATSAGCFFRYRPRKTKTSRMHPFQVVEVKRHGNQVDRLMWSQYRYFENDDGTFEFDQKIWATVDVDGSATVPNKLQVALGKTGFPKVTWNGRELKQADWDVEWEGMHASRLTRRQLAAAYLGRLGVFVNSGSASFNQTQLAYLD